MNEHSRIPYSRFGKNRPGTVWLIGGPGPSLWMPLVSSLSEYYNIIIPDILKSISKVKSSDSLLDPATILEMLKDSEEPVHLVGWSLGTSFSLAIFESAPERFASMTWICGRPNRLRPTSTSTSASLRREVYFNLANMLPAAAGYMAAHADRILRLQKKIVLLGSPARSAKRFGLLDPLTDDAAFDALVQEFLQIDSMRYRKYVDAVAHLSKEESPLNLSVPLLLVTGERDIFAPPKQLRPIVAEIPQCEYFEVISGTHYVPVEYGELLALKLDDFFKRAVRK